MDERDGEAERGRPRGRWRRRQAGSRHRAASAPVLPVAATWAQARPSILRGHLWLPDGRLHAEAARRAFACLVGASTPDPTESWPHRMSRFGTERVGWRKDARYERIALKGHADWFYDHETGEFLEELPRGATWEWNC